jgi:hypothetical protein
MQKFTKFIGVPIWRIGVPIQKLGSVSNLLFSVLDIQKARFNLSDFSKRLERSISHVSQVNLELLGITVSSGRFEGNLKVQFKQVAILILKKGVHLIFQLRLGEFSNVLSKERFGLLKNT